MSALRKAMNGLTTTVINKGLPPYLHIFDTLYIPIWKKPLVMSGFFAFSESLRERNDIITYWRLKKLSDFGRMLGLCQNPHKLGDNSFCSHAISL